MALSEFSVTFVILSILSIYAVHAAHHHHPDASAPAPSSSAAIDCWTLIPSMADCLSFVQSGSQASKPEGKCCSGLKTVINTKAECLCEAFKSSASMGVQVNMTKASTLPVVCNIPASSVPKCASSLTPAGAPGVEPSASAGAPTIPSGGASGVASPPAAGKSDSPVLSVPIGSLVIGLIIMLVSWY